MEYQETSREARESFAGVSGQLDGQILAVLEVNEAEGATCEEVENITGRKHQSVSGNLRNLVKRGIVADSGEKRELTSGRRGIVWVLARYAPPPEDSDQLSLFEATS